MKVFAVVFVIFVVIAAVWGLKDPRCELEHSKDGEDGKKCLALMPAYSYKQDTNECVYFDYGGCGGNDNRFNTLQDCENLCKSIE